MPAPLSAGPVPAPLCAGRVRGALARVGEALALALPQACALCAAPAGSRLLCMPCTAALPSLGPACVRCALPAPGRLDGAGLRASAGTLHVCDACRREPPPWTRACAAWQYAFPVDRLLHALKYGGHLALAAPLGQGLARAVIAAGAGLPDVLIPVPLAAGRARVRGFNQSALIARAAGRALRVPVRDALRRTRDTPAQASLGLAARAANVAAAFAARRRLDGLRVAIVDDVMTSGATLAATARAAQAAGARSVAAWACARTPPPGER